jgi:hypothetical protein
MRSVLDAGELCSVMTQIGLASVIHSPRAIGSFVSLAIKQLDHCSRGRSWQVIRTHTEHRRAMAHLPSPACESTNSRFCTANDFYARKSATAWPPRWREVRAGFEIAGLPTVPSSAAA